MKVILNKCFGGFGFSHEATMMYAKEKGFELYAYGHNSPDNYFRINNPDDAFLHYYFKKDFGEFPKEINWDEYFRLDGEYREDPVAVAIVEKLGDKASGRFSKLVVVDIPDGMKYVIDDYDGVETLHEEVRVW